MRRAPTRTQHIKGSHLLLAREADESTNIMSATSAARFAVVKFDDRNRYGRNGVPATLLFSAGQQIVIHMKDETIEKAGKLNRFAKVIVTGDAQETTRARAELVELLGQVGVYKDELAAYQLHFAVKPCRYPKERDWALTPLVEPPEAGRVDCAGLHVFSVDNVGTRDIDDALSLTPLKDAPQLAAALLAAAAGARAAAAARPLARSCSASTSTSRRGCRWSRRLRVGGDACASAYHGGIAPRRPSAAVPSPCCRRGSHMRNCRSTGWPNAVFFLVPRRRAGSRRRCSTACTRTL